MTGCYVLMGFRAERGLNIRASSGLGLLVCVKSCILEYTQKHILALGSLHSR